MEAITASRPAARVPVISLLITSVLIVVNGLFYHISRLVFAFLFIKIVFLIVKLVI